MLEGSAQVSRTNRARSTGEAALQRFRTAAELVVDHAAELPLTLATATRINRILNPTLSRELIRYQSSEVARMEANRTFLRWLRSASADELGRRDPVELASRVYRFNRTPEMFPDGNGRTWRLMADLALLKYGRAPALYTGIEDFFARGSSRLSDPGSLWAAPERAGGIESYFREIADAGQRALRARSVAKP